MSKNECHQLGDHSEEKLTARLLESHDKSHQQGMHPSQLSLTEEEKGEEFQGITAGLGEWLLCVCMCACVCMHVCVSACMFECMLREGWLQLLERGEEFQGITSGIGE